MAVNRNNEKFGALFLTDARALPALIKEVPCKSANYEESAGEVRKLLEQVYHEDFEQVEK